MAQPDPSPRRPVPGRPTGAVQGASARSGQIGDAGADVAADVLRRAARVRDDSGHEVLATVLAASPVGLQALSNALMDVYRIHQDQAAFALLFELNVRPFSVIAARMMRMVGCRADVNDILQDAFISIYRYPSRFRAETPHAFRNWAYSIIRNTIYRHAQRDAREGVPVDTLAETLSDAGRASPLRQTAEAEAGDRCQRTYLTLLWLYLEIFDRELKPRDQMALRLVEVEELGYREAAMALGIKLENFKMVVCRARKKIFRGLVRVLGTRQP